MDAVLDTCSRSRGENIREDQAAKEALGTPFGKTQKCAILTEMGKKIQAWKAIFPSTPVCMIGMMIVSGYLFKKMSENPLPSGFLSRHGVKEKHQPLYQKLVLTMAQKEGFVSPHSTLVGPLGSKAAPRPYSPPRGSNPSAPPNFLCKNKRDSDFSKSLSWLIPPRLIQYEKTEAGFALITGVNGTVAPSVFVFLPKQFRMD